MVMIDVEEYKIRLKNLCKYMNDQDITPCEELCLLNGRTSMVESILTHECIKRAALNEHSEA